MKIRWKRTQPLQWRNFAQSSPKASHFRLSKSLPPKAMHFVVALEQAFNVQAAQDAGHVWRLRQGDGYIL